MNAAPLPADPEVDDDEPAEEEEPLGISFFSEPDNEIVDQVVALRVWNIFARESREAGIPCSPKEAARTQHVISDLRARGVVVRPPQAVPAKSVAPPPPPPVEEKSMKKRGEMLRIVADAKAAFESVNGRAPSPRELFDTMDPTVAKSVGNVGMALKRLPGAPSARPAKPVAPSPSRPVAVARKPAAPAKRAAPSKTVAPPPVGDPIVAALLAKRAGLQAKIDAINVALEALSGDIG